jgi:hypothetical protein
MVGSFQDYQNKNKPANVIINYNSCQIKIPRVDGGVAKSAPNGQLKN